VLNNLMFWKACLQVNLVGPSELNRQHGKRKNASNFV